MKHESIIYIHRQQYLEQTFKLKHDKLILGYLKNKNKL